MKKKILGCSIVIIALITIIAIKPWGTKPYEDLSVEDISAVSVELMPPHKTIELSENQIQELVDVLQTVVIYNKVIKEPLAGQHLNFIITKDDGSILEVLPMGSLMQLSSNGTRYKAKYEPSEELNRLANEIEQNEDVLSPNYLTMDRVRHQGNTIYADLDTIDHIKVNLNEQQVKQFLEDETLTLDFERLFPVYSATRNVENADSLLETLVCYYEYNVPVLNEDGEAVALATIQYNGDYVIGMMSGENTFDGKIDFLETFYSNCDISNNTATYFVEVPSHSNGILNITKDNATFTFFEGAYGRTTEDSSDVLEALKGLTSTTNDEEG